mgnify:CR=1 FL=1
MDTSKQNNSAQFNFLEEYIKGVLMEIGIGELTEENRNKFMPQLISEAQYRLGLALTPHIPDEKMEEFTKMVDNEEEDPEKWKDFWEDAVPDYKDIVSETLDKFAKDCKTILSQQ